MDYNTTTPPLTNNNDDEEAKTASPTPTRVIIAQNIGKFFKLKSEMLMGGNSSTSPTSPNNNNMMDVNTVLNDVDLILEGRSVEDGMLLLRGMVADLLREVDLLRFRLDESQDNLRMVKEERDVVNNDYRDRLYSLVLALQNATTSSSTGDDDAPPPRNNITTTTQHDSVLQQRLQKGGLLTADEATRLTIATLTDKIVQLNNTIQQQTDALAQHRERMEDLVSENEAKTHKIAALEKQFQHINQKRHKVVRQLAASDNNNKASPSNNTVKSPLSNSYYKSPPPSHKKSSPMTSSSHGKAGRVARLVKLVDAN